MLIGVIDATDVPPDDPFAAGAHRIREPGLQPPRSERPLILGTDQTKPVRVVLVDAIVDATGHVLRVRTAEVSRRRLRPAASTSAPSCSFATRRSRRRASCRRGSTASR